MEPVVETERERTAVDESDGEPNAVSDVVKLAQDVADSKPLADVEARELGIDERDALAVTQPLGLSVIVTLPDAELLGSAESDGEPELDRSGLLVRDAAAEADAAPLCEDEPLGEGVADPERLGIGERDARAVTLPIRLSVSVPRADRELLGDGDIDGEPEVDRDELLVRDAAAVADGHTLTEGEPLGDGVAEPDKLGMGERDALPVVLPLGLSVSVTAADRELLGDAEIDGEPLLDRDELLVLEAAADDDAQPLSDEEPLGERVADPERLGEGERNALGVVLPLALTVRVAGADRVLLGDVEIDVEPRLERDELLVLEAGAEADEQPLTEKEPLGERDEDAQRLGEGERDGLGVVLPHGLSERVTKPDRELLGGADADDVPRLERDGLPVLDAAAESEAQLLNEGEPLGERDEDPERLGEGERDALAVALPHGLSERVAKPDRELLGGADTDGGPRSDRDGLPVLDAGAEADGDPLIENETRGERDEDPEWLDEGESGALGVALPHGLSERVARPDRVLLGSADPEGGPRSDRDGLFELDAAADVDAAPLCEDEPLGERDAGPDRLGEADSVMGLAEPVDDCVTLVMPVREGDPVADSDGDVDALGDAGAEAEGGADALVEALSDGEGVAEGEDDGDTVPPSECDAAPLGDPLTEADAHIDGDAVSVAPCEGDALGDAELLTDSDALPERDGVTVAEADAV